jgi:hypothetical protein
VSAVPPGALPATGGAGQTVALVPIQRSIGGIIAYTTVRETMRDDMTITEHPVENGANISDHAYKMPSEIEIEVGWPGTAGQPADFYNRLRGLQSQRQPFDVYTDRRVYHNMLVAGIATVTEQRTAYSFMALVRCRQINLVSTQSTVVGSINGESTVLQTTQPQSDQGTGTLKSGSPNTKSGTWQSLGLPASKYHPLLPDSATNVPET